MAYPTPRETSDRFSELVGELSSEIDKLIELGAGRKTKTMMVVNLKQTTAKLTEIYREMRDHTNNELAIHLGIYNETAETINQEQNERKQRKRARKGKTLAPQSTR